MVDIVDRANDMIEENYRIKMLDRANKQTKTTVECEDCGVHIPKDRQEATGGTSQCIDCAEIAEIRARRK